MKLEIISAKNPMRVLEVTKVSLPSSMGPFVVLRNHAPIVASLVEGSIVWDGGECRVKAGFAKVKDNVVTAVVEE